jgi:hypothetical protein
LPTPLPLQAFGRFFCIKERNTSLTQEIRGGSVTFLTVAYILAVNSAIITETGGAHPHKSALPQAMPTFGPPLQQPLLTSAFSGLQACAWSTAPAFRLCPRRFKERTPAHPTARHASPSCVHPSLLPQQVRFGDLSLYPQYSQHILQYSRICALIVLCWRIALLTCTPLCLLLTCVFAASCVIANFLMGILGNLPLAIAPAMGLNAYL